MVPVVKNGGRERCGLRGDSCRAACQRRLRLRARTVRPTAGAVLSLVGRFRLTVPNLRSRWRKGENEARACFQDRSPPSFCQTRIYIPTTKTFRSQIPTPGRLSAQTARYSKRTRSKKKKKKELQPIPLRRTRPYVAPFPNLSPPPKRSTPRRPPTAPTGRRQEATCPRRSRPPGTRRRMGAPHLFWCSGAAALLTSAPDEQHKEFYLMMQQYLSDAEEETHYERWPRAGRVGGLLVRRGGGGGIAPGAAVLPSAACCLFADDTRIERELNTDVLLLPFSKGCFGALEEETKTKNSGSTCTYCRCWN